MVLCREYLKMLNDQIVPLEVGGKTLVLLCFICIGVSACDVYLCFIN